MSEEELRKKLNNDFYSRRIVQIEQSCPPEENLAKQVGWRSYNSQQENFQFLADVLADVANIDWSDTNTSVLDIGCGFGELLRYLRQIKEFQGKYTGIDILDAFIKMGSKLHSNDNRNYFISSDVLSYEWKDSQYDFVLSIGSVATNYDYPEPYGKKTLEFAFKLVNLMCQLSRKYAGLHYINEKKYSPEEIIANRDLAFYDPHDIEEMFIKATSGNYKKLITKAVPGNREAKLITSICF